MFTHEKKIGRPNELRLPGGMEWELYLETFEKGNFKDNLVFFALKMFTAPSCFNLIDSLQLFCQFTSNDKVVY